MLRMATKDLPQLICKKLNRISINFIKFGAELVKYLICSVPEKFVVGLAGNEFKLTKKGKQHEYKRKSQVV